MSAETSPAVLLTIEDGVAEIRFNRPERLNALSVEVANGFDEAVDRALADPKSRVIVLSAEGRAFVAGGDLKHIGSASDRGAAAEQLFGPAHAALQKLAAADPIVIASVKGAVAGAGMSLCINADLSIAADDAVLNLAYTKIAGAPDCGGSWALPRLVGMRKALEIALLSDNISAHEALALGLVNKVVPRDELEAKTRELALRLANGPTTAFGVTKRLIRTSLDRTYGEQLDAEASGFRECAAHPDFAEAVGAFFEKRKPVFKRD
jgi:2-(1,2-epoxy-1,2-dihydrophenyl)acetyl-CoA isomerase